MMMGPAASDSPVLIEISDGAGGFGYTLDTLNKVAHRYKYFAPAVHAVPRQMTVATLQMAPAIVGGGNGGPVAPGVRARPEVSTEEIGPQMIEGVMAKGRRTISTWAIGTQGNDRPFQTVSEIWTSPDLNIMVLSKNSDPRSGDNITKLININRAEPDPSLFAPPPDYTIVDETGPFQIDWINGPRQ